MLFQGIFENGGSKLNAEVSQWVKAQLFSSHHHHIQFPKHLTFKFVLHGFILRNENQRANN